MEPSYALILANQDFSQVTETANQILLSATQSRGNMHKLKYKNLFHLNIKWGKNPTFFLYYSSVQILSRFVEKLWNLHSWRYSNPHQSWAACLDDRVLSRAGCCTRRSPVVPSNFCNSVISYLSQTYPI